MEESSFCFLSENEDNVDNDILLENKTLKEHNNQLKSKIEAVSGQLKEALMVSESYKELENQIKLLNERLESANNDNEELRSLIRTKDNDENARRSQETARVFKLKNELDSLKNIRLENEKLLGDTNKYIQEIEEMNKKDEMNHHIIGELKKKKKKLEKKCSTFQKEIIVRDNDIKLLFGDIEKYKSAIRDLEEENKNLKVKANEKMNSTKDIRDNTRILPSNVNDIEQSLHYQRIEIEELATQRDSLITMIQKLYSAISKSENCLETSMKEMDSLKTKVNQFKTYEKLNNNSDKLNFDDIRLPFSVEINAECERIATLDQFQGSQKIQLILNYLAKQFVISEEKHSQAIEIIDKIKGENEAIKNKYSIIKCSLDALLADLKIYLIGDVDKSMNSNDLAFIQHMSKQIASIPDCIQDGFNSHPIRNSILISDDISQRQNILKSLLQQNEPLYCMFSTIFLINILIRKHVITESSSSKSESILHLLDCKDQNEAIEKIRRILFKYKDLKLNFDNLRIILDKKKSLNAIRNEKDRTYSTEHLKSQIEELITERDLLKTQLSLTKSRLLINNSQDLSQSSSEKKLLSKISELENSLQLKQNEIDELNSLILEMKSKIENHILRERYLNEEANKLQNCIKNLKNENNKCTENLTRTIKKQKKRKRSLDMLTEQIKAQQNYYDSEISQMTPIINELKEKIKEAQDQSSKYLQSLTESEERTKLLIEENSKLVSLQKSMESHICSLNDTIRKEKNNLQCQLSAQSLLIESKNQDKVLQMKNELLSEKSKIYDLIASTIGKVYSIDRPLIDDYIVDEILEKSHRDLMRFQQLQSSMIDKSGNQNPKIVFSSK